MALRFAEEQQTGKVEEPTSQLCRGEWVRAKLPLYFFCGVGLKCRLNVAHVAQVVERVLGKDEVSGSIPLVGSTTRWGSASLVFVGPNDIVT